MKSNAATEPHAQTPSGETRTFVLVHGAYHGAWCWKDVATRLRSHGHVVYTPTQTGLGERSHLLPFKPTLDTFVEDVVQVIKYEDLEDVILVGHSFGGSTISGVADRMPERLRHLVYLDALVLLSGQSSASMAPERVEAYRKRAVEEGDGTGIPPANPQHFGITDPQLAAWTATKLTPHPLQTYYDKLVLTHPVGNGVPATYIACTNPYNASTEKSREVARGMRGWKYVEIQTGHDAMLTTPGALAEMFCTIA